MPSNRAAHCMPAGQSGEKSLGNGHSKDCSSGWIYRASKRKTEGVSPGRSFCSKTRQRNLSTPHIRCRHIELLLRHQRFSDCVPMLRAGRYTELWWILDWKGPREGYDAITGVSASVPILVKSSNALQSSPWSDQCSPRYLFLSNLALFDFSYCTCATRETSNNATYLRPYRTSKSESRRPN